MSRPFHFGWLGLVVLALPLRADLAARGEPMEPESFGETDFTASLVRLQVTDDESDPRRLERAPLTPPVPTSPRGSRAAGAARPVGPSRFRRSSVRLARAPPIFGDFSWWGSAATQVNVALLGAAFSTADIPLAAGSRRVKVSEHNRALPTDRVVFSYNHFHNALESSLAPAPNAPPFSREAFSVNRFTFGLEKTFQDGDWSVELRLPLTDRDEVSNTNPAIPNTPAFQLIGGNVGDLAVVLKRLVYLDDAIAISAGLGLNTPTGSDVRSNQAGPPPPESFSITNEAFHLLPFVGAMSTPSDRSFWHVFAQLDVATNGNRVDIMSPVAPPQRFLLNDQALLYLDLSAGYWLYQNPCSRGLTSLSATVELHYTTTLENADLVPLLGGFGSLGNLNNRVDLWNLTLGFHAGLGECTDLRLGGVFPLTNEPERFFDAEVQAAVIRRF